MEVKRSKLLRLINKKMITLPWGVYAAPSADVREIDVTHEFIHIKQCRELWYIGFYLWYAIEFLIRFAAYGFNGRMAYKNISLELEAYDNDDNSSYLDEREKFSFLKYILK